MISVLLALAASAGAAPPPPIRRFSTRSPAAMAVYLADAQDQGFALAHAATAMGIPVFFTRDLAQALAQPMVATAGELSGAALTAAVAARLDAYVRAGGTLILDDVESRGAQDLAGLSGAVASSSRCAIAFGPANLDPALARLTAPPSATISIGSQKTRQAILTQGLSPRSGAGVATLARFDDGTAAVVRRDLGRGRVYALGATFTDLILRPQGNHDFDAQRFYDNHFEPSADVPQIFLRDLYAARVPAAVTVDPVPDGLEGALILTHDIDYRRSVVNMLAYAGFEFGAGVSATYFVQTKYIKDYEDEAFFDAAARRIVAQVLRLGADIGSHSVSHAYDWSQFPLGTGRETADDYRPTVLSRGASSREGRTAGGSVTGEIRVSRALLKDAVPRAPLEAYRTGYLNINPAQWDVLAQNGFRFDSSYSADDVMTVFPYEMMARAGFDVESGVLQFPVLLLDSVAPLEPRIPSFLTVLDQEALFHGVCVVLLHPDVVGEKLRVEKALVDHVRGRFWIGNLSNFGDFWRGRAAARVRASGGPRRLVVAVTADRAVTGLTLDFPRRVVLLGSTGTGARPARSDRAIVLGALPAGATATLTLSERP